MRRTALLILTLAIAAWTSAGLHAPEAHAGGGCRGTAATQGAGDSVSMDDHLCFVPTVLHVERGTTVTWTNEGKQPHNVAGATLEWGNYEEYGYDESVSFAFAEPGTYPYYCFVHNGMIGAIVVGDGKSVSTNPAEANTSARLASSSGADTSDQPAQQAPLATTTGDSDAQRLAYAGLGAIGGAVTLAAALALYRQRKSVTRA